MFSLKLSWRGEPTLNPRLPDMVRYAKARGIPDVAFLTNGGLMTPELTRALVDAGLDWISFSIDGLGADYERIRKPITFAWIEGVVKGLHDLKRREGARSRWCACRPSRLHRAQPGIFRLLGAVGGPHRGHRRAAPRGPELIRHDPDYVCASPFQRVFVTWNGDVVPCHGDYFLHNRMGNAGEQSIADIWNGARFREFRAAMRAGGGWTTRPAACAPTAGSSSATPSRSAGARCR